MNNIIPSLYKALQLIHQLSEKNYTQVELSKKLKITMSTTYRILCTLLAEGWVVKKKDTSYMLGGGMLPLLSFFNRDVARMEAVRDIIAEIPEETGLFAKLSIACGNLHHVTVYNVAPDHERMQLSSSNGSTFSLIDGPTGAALLADRKPEQLKKLCANSIGATDEKKNPDILIQSVAHCQKEGYALANVQRTRWAVAAMAVPVRFEGKIIAAITAMGCSKDFEGTKERATAKVLKEIAKRCEKTISEV